MWKSWIPELTRQNAASVILNSPSLWQVICFASCDVFWLLMRPNFPRLSPRKKKKNVVMLSMTLVFKAIQKINMTICLHSLFLWVSENCINCLIYISIRVHQLRGISGIIILVEYCISQNWSRVRGLAVNQVTFHFLLTFLFPLQKIFDAKPWIMSTVHPMQTARWSSSAAAAGRCVQSCSRGTSPGSTGWIDSHLSWW